MEAFVHPHHWIETVKNAELGSLKSQTRLARAEVEAIHASERAVRHFIDFFQNKKDNDRTGVRKILETYLPCPLMEPLDRKAWES
jgi:hypothetical protein